MTRLTLPSSAWRLTALTLSSLCLLHGVLHALSPVYAQASPPLKPSDVIARYETPTGPLALTYSELLAWRALQARATRSTTAPPPQLSLNEELKALALDLYTTRTTPLNTLSPDAQREVLRSRDRALAWAYLSEVHERDLTEESVPQRYVDLALKQNLGLFRHPPLKRGVHFLIHTSYDLSVSTKPPIFNEQDLAKVMPIAEAIYQRIQAHPPHTGASLRDRLASYQALVPEGYTLRFEDLGTFPQRGRFVAPFSDACFALQEGERLTPPVKTQFGVHIAWIDEHIPAKDTPQAEIDAEVRRRILDEVRGLELNRALSADRERSVWVDEGYFLYSSPTQQEGP